MRDLIYNQKKIPKEQWRYGFRSSAAVGCGWIATYNALRILGWKAEPEELIRYYERQLPLIHGNAGTSIWAPAVFFKQQGFPVEVTANRKKFDDAARNADVCILFYRWHSHWKLGAHFVTVECQDGIFVGYNTYTNSFGPDVYGQSLDGFLRKKKYFCPVLISIHKKKENSPVR